MIKRALGFIAALALAAVPVLARAQDTTHLPPMSSVAPEATRAATAGLGTFRQLLELQKNYREMGFESAAELDGSTLGEPFGQRMVRLDELSEFKPGGNALALLHDTRQVLYPVQVGGRTRSSITVVATEKGWTANGFGNASKAALLERTRARVTEAARVPAAQTALVEVPGMKLVFVGFVQEGALWLAPVIDYPAFGLQAGVPVRADEAFARIAPATKSYRDAPG